MSGYRMILTLGSRQFELPVLPEKLEVSSPGQNETVTVLNIGEINRLKEIGLREIEIESLFPRNKAPYVTGQELLEPLEYVRLIQTQRARKEPVRLKIYGVDLGLNYYLGIEEFTYEERSGELGDLYYTLKLKEWKEYSAKRLTLINTAQGKAKVTVSSAKRPGTPVDSKSHAVVKGDSLWSICKKHYGDGSRYPQLYAKNKALIDKRNKETGQSKYTVYPGQVITL